MACYGFSSVLSFPAARGVTLCAASHVVATSLPLAATVGIAAMIDLILLIVLAAAAIYWLRYRKALLRDLFEANAWSGALTALDGRVLNVNVEFTRLFGIPARDAIGRPLADLILPPEGREEFLQNWTAMRERRRVDAEIVCRRQDGRQFPVALSLVPVFPPAEKPVVYVNCRDITERRDSEAARWASEGRWRAVFDNFSVGISVTDVDGKFIATNRAYQEMVGYSEDDLRGLTYLDLTYEEDRARNAELAAGLWAGSLPQYQMEKRYRRKDGGVIWTRITVSKGPGVGPKPAFGVCIVEDITQSKRAADSLLEYERVVENLQEMILVIDREYRYLIANPAYLRYRNLAQDQVVGHKVRELMGSELFDGVIQSKMDECFQGKIVNYEISVNYPTLGLREVQVSYFPIEGAYGVDRISIVLQDVTERNRAEKQLQRSFEELHGLTAQLQTVREEERTRLARELHDELGQSLTAIKIDLASLKNPIDRDRQVRKINAILGLVDETIQSVRRISTELRPGILDDLGLVAAVEWAAEEFEARTHIQCRLSLPEPSPAIDPKPATALFRIFQETMTNVARHSGATQVKIGLREERGGLALEVCDNGQGIGPDQVSASTSLGILGMRERALLLGGDFSISGDPGTGTVVRVRIPQTPRSWTEAVR